MAQMTESNREVSSLQARYDELRLAKDTLGEQLDVTKAHNGQLMEDLKATDRAKDLLQVLLLSVCVVTACFFCK